MLFAKKKKLKLQQLTSIIIKTIIECLQVGKLFPIGVGDVSMQSIDYFFWPFSNQ